MEFDAIIFDFGNTLIPWGQRQALGLYHAVRDVMDPMDDFDARAREAHMGLVRQRENGSMAEVTCAEFVSAILGETASDELVRRVEQAAGAAFVELAVVPEHVRPILEALRGRYRLAVLSNFFLEGPVEEVLRRSGLADCFDHVEISATGGWMKPHPEPFDKVRMALGSDMERTLMVGDDFFADIVGGYRAGLLTALTHEYHQAEPSDARAPEVTPDLILTSLHELPR